MTKMAKIEKASRHQVYGEVGMRQVDDVKATSLVGGPKRRGGEEGRERSGLDFEFL